MCLGIEGIQISRLWPQDPETFPQPSSLPGGRGPIGASGQHQHFQPDRHGDLSTHQEPSQAGTCRGVMGMAQDRRGPRNRQAGKGGASAALALRSCFCQGTNRAPRRSALQGDLLGTYPSPPPPAPDNPTLAISTLPLGDRPQSFGGFQGRAGLQGATHTWLKDPLCSSTSCRALRVRAFRRGTQGQVREPSSLGVPGVSALLREGGGSWQPEPAPMPKSGQSCHQQPP